MERCGKWLLVGEKDRNCFDRLSRSHRKGILLAAALYKMQQTVNALSHLIPLGNCFLLSIVRSVENLFWSSDLFCRRHSRFFFVHASKAELGDFIQIRYGSHSCWLDQILCFDVETEISRSEDLLCTSSSNQRRVTITFLGRRCSNMKHAQCSGEI